MWFHIRLLERCNLSCTSCYAKNNDRTKTMAVDLFKEILKKIKSLGEAISDSAVIYLSGGEPLLHPEFLSILTHACFHFKRVHLLTNGLLIEDIISDIKKFKDRLGVQVSLDGSQDINDMIRGRGAYAKAVAALVELEKNEMKHWLSYTVSRLNKSCFQEVLDIAKKTRSCFNNVTPYTGDRDLMLDYDEWKEFKYHFLTYARKINHDSPHGLNSCGFTYLCGAFSDGLTINPDGAVGGCARLKEIKGGYDKMEKYLIDKSFSMNRMCMKSKWGHINNFPFLTRVSDW